MHKSSPNPKITFGFIIMVIGFLSPLLIPLVLGSSWSAAAKTTISGLLAFGIPELFILLAVAVMGKEGYNYLKGKMLNFLKRFAPPDTVSKRRYHIGLILFCLPLVAGIILPYMSFSISFLKEIPVWLHAALDLTLVIGFFVLGGDFWDKFSGLFKYNVKVENQSEQPLIDS